MTTATTPMMPDLKEIKLSREGRSYRKWQSHSGTKYGLKYNANWVVFPTRYEWHTADPANRWICPIRDCRNIFPTIKKLEAHTMKLHRGVQLNDNRDGTTSVVGAWDSDYLRVVSQKRTAPGAPPPAKPSLPLASHLQQLHHQKLTPPSSPPRHDLSSDAIVRPPRSQTEDTVLRMAIYGGRDDRDPTMPAETPITTRLETAKKSHRRCETEMASLGSAVSSGGSDTRKKQETTVVDVSNEDDDAVVFDDDQDDDNDNLFVLEPSTPKQSSSNPGPMLQSSVKTSSTQSVSTPVGSLDFSTQPLRRSSQRLAIRRLSSSDSTFGLDTESPSRRRPTRMNNMMGDALSAKTLLRPASMKLDARPRRMSGTSSNGRSGAREFMTPSTGQKRGASQAIFFDDEGDGQDMEAMLTGSPTNRAAKRRGVLRLQIHVPKPAAVDSSDKAKSGDANMLSGHSTLSGGSPYLSPPNSQESATSSSSPGCGDSCFSGCGRSTAFKMEDWEISPGKITATPSVATASPSKAAERSVRSVLKPSTGAHLKSPDLAYSSSYLAQQEPVPMSPGIGAHKVQINCGDQYRFPTSGSGARRAHDAGGHESDSASQKKERFCFVGAGKALVKMSRPTLGEGRLGVLDFEQKFTVGLNSMFKVAHDMDCLVSNFHDVQLVLNVMEVAIG